jgi:hypothetical protein
VLPQHVPLPTVERRPGLHRGAPHSRQILVERHHDYERMLGLTSDSQAVPDTLQADRRELTEDNFDEAHAGLVVHYDRAVPAPEYPPVSIRHEGRLQLHSGEYDDLNVYAERALASKISSSATDAIMGLLALIPTFHLKPSFGA